MEEYNPDNAAPTKPSGKRKSTPKATLDEYDGAALAGRDVAAAAAASGLSEYDAEPANPRKPRLPKHQLVEPSAEQSTIVNAMRNGNNCVVDAVAGSGKTTTVLHVANSMHEHRILLLTYNASLRLDTRERAKKLKITNLEVHTYHSFCYKYVNTECVNDAGIMRHLPGANYHYAKYNVVIIDEAQDMTPLYYNVALHAIADDNPQLLILGDRNQSIYQYKGSDPRYLTFAPQLFNSAHPWVKLSLSVSYRVTRQMAAFVNEIRTDDAPRITAVRDGPLPEYLYCSPESLGERVAAAARVHGPENIFVLAPSVRIKRGNRLSGVSNYLTRHKIPIYMPISDDREPDDRATAGKVAFVTFHQSKGRERKIVFVASFDATLQYDGETECPSIMYVATTRATERLYIWHTTTTGAWQSSAPPHTLPFVNIAGIKPLCTFPCGEPPLTSQTIQVTRFFPTAVTELTRHIPEFYSSYIMGLIKRDIMQEPNDLLQVPSVVKQGAFYEEVSDLTGNASTARYEIDSTGQCTIHNITRGRRICPGQTLSAGDLLLLSRDYNAKTTKINFRKSQIIKFDWVTEENFNIFSQRLAAVAPGPNQFEVTCSCNDFDYAARTITMRRGEKINPPREDSVCGATDIISGDVLYEVKTVSALQPEHYIQLLIYYYMYLRRGRRLTPLLFNVLSGELVRINISDDDLIRAMKAINHNKFHTEGVPCDEEFLARSMQSRSVPEIIAGCPRCVGKFTEPLPIL